MKQVVIAFIALGSFLGSIVYADTVEMSVQNVTNCASLALYNCRDNNGDCDSVVPSALLRYIPTLLLLANDREVFYIGQNSDDMCTFQQTANGDFDLISKGKLVCVRYAGNRVVISGTSCV